MGVGIVGTGIDVVEVTRVAEALARHGDRFVDRVFTSTESAYCRSTAAPEQHFAARFAAKEAVLKALKTGWIKGIGWRDVEVRKGPEGGPSVALSGGAARRAEEMGVAAVHLSMSHTARHAVAQAIAEGAG